MSEDKQETKASPEKGKLLKYEWEDLDDEETREEYREEGKTFEEMYMGSDKSLNIKEGEVVSGKVIHVSRDYVMVDIGYKSEGQVAISEFLGTDGKINVKVGDEINVYLEKIEDDQGAMILSKDKADILRAWDDLSAACEKDELVEGTVVAKVKGGLSVDIGIKAFLPGSQVDVRPTRNLDQYVGKKYKFKIIKFNKKRGNIVLSRRILLEKERETMRAQTLERIKEGEAVRGIVKNITEYGAFIDLGGIDGLLHITDMSWGRIKHPSELFNLGDELDLRVLKYDPEKERVSLGLKQLVPDPWDSVDAKYPVEARVTGKVVSLTDYGAFVELETGVEGLIHVSEMSWLQRVKHPSKIVSPNQVVEAVVLDVDKTNRRISLGMKQIEANPWEVLTDKYPPGTRIKSTIKNVTDFGIFLGIEEGIDGLVHISDLSWDPRITHPSQLFKKGQEVEAVVLNIDQENERFSLGIKQLEQDPWEKVEAAFPLFSIHEGPVTKITDFGLFIDLGKGVEGLLHISELSIEKIEKLSKHFKVGDNVRFAIISVDRRERKIGLSMKALKKIEENETLTEYETKAKQKKAPQFGDVLDSAMKEKLDSFKKE